MTKETYLLHRKMCIDKLYSRLNGAQREAVTTVNGPLLVLAGAGSGKTTVLVNRIYHIINFGSLCENNDVPENADSLVEEMKSSLSGNRADLERCLKKMAVSPCSPENILCITFTNKAAGEFKTRLADLLGSDVSGEIWAGTFHSVCAKILRKYIHLLGFSNSFTIYDTDDCKKLMTQIIKDFNIDDKVLPAKLLLSVISKNKEQRILPDEAKINASDRREEKIADVYAEYQKRLKEASALDFDDLILNTLILLEEAPDVLEKLQKQFRYILVDEYQDTNPSQNDLVLTLGAKSRNVCVVGDDDQSIYSFRGAAIGNILDFDKAFRDAKIIKLEQNYRSTSTILDAANAVIANNTKRRGKELWTSGEKGDKIICRSYYTQAEEADAICGEIMKLHAFGTPLKDIAILYRVNAIANSLETAFVKNRLPYRIFGGIRFYERKEIKDIVAYLSLISNHSDNVRLRRIVNVPRRQIGDTTIEHVSSLAEENGISMLDVMKNSASYPSLVRSAGKLERFYGLIADLGDYAASHTVTETVEEVIKATGYEQMLGEENESEKIDNVHEFVSSALLYEQSTEEPTLEGFLGDISLVSDIDSYDTAEESVSLMTVHSAKGLEFPIVFLPGFEENIFPSAMSVGEGNMEEERRLAYVAITRAKTKLYITYTQSRTIYGMTSPSLPSVFLSEIPDECKDVTAKKVRIDPYARPAETPYRKEKRVEDLFRPREKASPASLFVKGDRVKHKFFGDGTVLSYEQMGSDALIEVEFDSGMNKKLMASFAKLEKI